MCLTTVKDGRGMRGSAQMRLCHREVIHRSWQKARVPLPADIRWRRMDCRLVTADRVLDEVGIATGSHVFRRRFFSQDSQARPAFSPGLFSLGFGSSGWLLGLRLPSGKAD